MIYLEWVGTILVILQIYLYGINIKYGATVGFTASVIWCVYAFNLDLNGIFVSNFILSGVNLNNLYKQWKK